MKYKEYEITIKESDIINKLEIIGVALARCIKKNKIREYIVSRKYAVLALDETQKTIIFIRNGIKNGIKTNS